MKKGRPGMPGRPRRSPLPADDALLLRLLERLEHASWSGSPPIAIGPFHEALLAIRKITPTDIEPEVSFPLFKKRGSACEQMFLIASGICSERHHETREMPSEG